MMASKEKIAAVVGVMCEAFNRKATPVTFKAYEIALTDIGDESLTEAGNAVLRGTGEFMPTPGQLRQLCLTGGKSYESRADIAWHEFDRAVSLEGADRTVTFADGLINATARLCGGWIRCCEKSGDDYFVWLKKEFKQTYIRLCETGASAEMRGPLTGRLEMANSGFPDETLKQLKAYTGAEPVVVGTSQQVIAPPTEPRKHRTIGIYASTGPNRVARDQPAPKQLPPPTDEDRAIAAQIAAKRAQLGYDRDKPQQESP